MTKKKRSTKTKKKKVSKKVIKSTPLWKDRTIQMILVGLAVITFITFFPSLDNGFTNWDDQDYVKDNPYIINLNGASIKAMFSQAIASNYHPLTILSLAFNYQMTVLDASSYHWTNLILHILNTGLVFFFVYLFSGKKWEGAFVVALLFAIHPMHVESVAWVAERKDVLYTAFFLGGMILYLRYLDDKKVKTMVWVGVLFLLSLWSKPTAVTFPVVLILIDFIKGRNIMVLKPWLEKLPFFILSIIFGLITINIQSGSAIGGLEDYTLWQRVMFASYGVYAYIAKLFVPIGLSTFHPYPVIDQIPVIFMAAPFIVLVLVAGVFYALRFTKIIAFGFAFYLVKIALTLQFVQVGSAIISERYTYMAYIGLFMILGAGIDYLLSQKDPKYDIRKKAAIGVIGLASVVFAFLSFKQSDVWQDSGTLWNNVIKVYPNASTPYNNLGNYLMDELQDFEGAHANLTKAVELNPKYYKAYIARGQVYRRTKRYQEALNDYNYAISLKPEFSDAYNNRGNIYFEMGQDDNALADYAKVAQIEPNEPKAYGNSGAIYARKAQLSSDSNQRNQNFQLALENLNRGIQLNPGYADALMNRGVVHSALGDPNAAIKDFTANQRISKPNHLVLYWRGLEYQKLNQHQQALNDFNQAIALNPNEKGYYRGRAATHSALGNAAAAAEDQARGQ
ncbi:MAG: tetratricopeptide repeat protein [Bacteroidota bacterium]